MKRLLLLLLLSQAWALTLTKTVSGPELIDPNQTLEVSLVLDSSEPFFLERVEDDVPQHFALAGAPSACRLVERELVCDFGQEFQGQVVVRYELVSLGVGYGIFGSPRVYYGEGVKTIDYMRPYFIGKPRVQLTLQGENTLLPGEDIAISVRLANPGAKPVGDVLLTLDYPNGSRKETLSLSAGESMVKEFVLGKAQKTGHMRVAATASWANMTSESSLSIIFISPDVSVERSVKSRWRVEGGELTSYVEVVYSIRNDGTAPGNLSFASGEGFGLGTGETKLLKETYAEKAPAEEIVVRDARGTEYETFSFSEETPEPDKDFFTLIYEYAGSTIPSWLAFLVLLGALYFSTRFENPYIKAGFLVIALVSLLLIYSQYSVGALRFPGPGPTT